MKFSKVFPLLIAKAERKGRMKEEVYAVTEWLTGYKSAELEQLLRTELTYGDFFEKTPCLNETHRLIQGSVCGVRVETIAASLMQNIHYLNKLVDELAKEKPLEKILRKCQGRRKPQIWYVLSSRVGSFCLSALVSFCFQPKQLRRRVSVQRCRYILISSAINF